MVNSKNLLNINLKKFKYFKEDKLSRSLISQYLGYLFKFFYYCTRWMDS